MPKFIKNQNNMKGKIKMNIYDYIDSYDTAKYCRSINRQFTPVETAVIIYHSRNKTVEEKHDAYRWITENIPDCAMPKSKSKYGDITLNTSDCDDCEYYPSLHECLRELIQSENKIYDYFKKQEQGYYYDLEGADDGYYYDATTYLCWENAIKEALGTENKRAFSITKKAFGDADGNSSAEVNYNKNGEAMRFSGNTGVPEAERSLSCDLGSIYFDLPVPFKIGDIVKHGNSNKPYVLYKLPDFSTPIVGHPSSYAWGYYMDEKGRLNDDNGELSVWDMEYYFGVLTGRNRFMKVLSRHIQQSRQNRGKKC
jgi:hypothetical protein